MNKRVTVNSKELLFRESNEHASVAYSIGKHLARTRLNTTSSEANLSTLLFKALNALKKHDLALSKLHLKVQPLLAPWIRQCPTNLRIKDYCIKLGVKDYVKYECCHMIAA